MGLGFKYHVVTIAAIFFALTIGLVVGSLFVAPHVANQQAHAIENLSKTLSAENRSLRATTEQWREFAATVTPRVLRGKLNGFRVAIIQTGDYPDALTRARDALALADAQLASIITMERNFDHPDELLGPDLAKLHADDPRFATDRAGLADSIAAILAHGDSAEDGFMPALERENFIHTEPGSNFQARVQYVVIVAGSRSEGALRPTNVDKPLIEALERQGLTVVMCEPEDALVSDVGAYHNLGLDIATVDNIDSDIGQCALIFALLGDKGDFGIKSTANKLLPPTISRQDIP